MRFPIALCLAAFLASCVSMNPDKPAFKTDKKHYVALLQLSDLNQGAMKYVSYCGKEGDVINPAFMKNAQYVSDKLFDETQKTFKASPQAAAEEMMKRRTYLKNFLDKVYHERGCDFAEARQAKEQYKFMSEFTTQQIDRLVKEGVAGQDRIQGPKVM